MSAHRPFKIGVVGCGRISQSHMHAIAEVEDLQVAGVTDLRADVAQAAAEAANCPGYPSPKEFAEDSGAEAAIICTPPDTHREIACLLLERGMHVLCEKPFATSIDEAKGMIQCARQHDRELMMASKFRYVEDVIRAKAMISSGLLGDVMFFENTFCSKVDMRSRWNSDPRIAGGGVLIDNGTHSIDIARYLLGPIESVHAIHGRHAMGLPVEDTATVGFRTETGVLGNINLSWSINVSQAAYINVWGTDGRLNVGWRESKYQHGNGDWISFGVGYDKIEAFRRLVTNFVDTARGSSEPVITLDDALASVELIDAAYRSMTERGLPNVGAPNEEPSWQPTGA